jgi:F0F1-type ATP synthase assembly protein I
MIMLKSELDALSERIVAEVMKESARTVRGADYFVGGMVLGILLGYLLKMYGG